MIDDQIKEVERAAERTENIFMKDFPRSGPLPPSRLKDANGSFLMTPLLVARAQVLLAITELKVSK